MLKFEFYTKAYAAACAAGDPWPEFSIVDCALESGWGESLLASKHCNMFGQKQGHVTSGCPTVDIPTHEQIDGKMVAVGHCTWAVFPDWTASFRARLNLMRSMSVYTPALTAKSGEEFIRKLEPIWATDSGKAAKVLAQHSRDLLIIQAVVKAAHALQGEPSVST